MRLRAFAAVACLLAMSGSQADGSAIDSVKPPPSEVTIANSRRFDLVSRVNGHRYSITVAIPFGVAPAKGYGALYVLDGYSYFASAAEFVRGFNAPGVVVVGIGYPHDATFEQAVITRRGPMPASYGDLPRWLSASLLERVYDLTLPAGEGDLADQARLLRGCKCNYRSKDVGGLDNFLATIESEIKPRVAALVPIDSRRQALFGHSYGGLAALHALLVEPNAFETFIISSPSIWWNHKEVLSDEPRFAAAVTKGEASPRVLVTVGGEESTPPKFVPDIWAMTDEEVKIVLRNAKMVENGREVVDWLHGLHGSPPYVVADYAVFDKENHTTAAWSALARGVGFAFSPTR